MKSDGSPPVGVHRVVSARVVSSIGEGDEEKKRTVTFPVEKNAAPAGVAEAEV